VRERAPRRPESDPEAPPGRRSRDRSAGARLPRCATSTSLVENPTSLEKRARRGRLRSCRRAEAWSQNRRSARSRKKGRGIGMNLGKVACSVVAVLLAAGAAIRAENAAPPEKPVVLLPGLGNLHHTIKTRSPEAQQFFDQGLTLVYGFNHDEAIRSFRRAAELDPDAVMPLWGIGYAL